MKNKKSSFWVGAVLAVVLICNLAVSKVSAVTFSSITSDSIKEKEGQIAQALDEKKQLQSGLTNIKNIKKNLENKKSDLKKYVAELDAQLQIIEENIAQLIDKICFKEQEIEVAEDELHVAMDREDQQRSAMVDHVRLVYESGDPQMTDMLSRAVNFGDFLNKADYVEKVMNCEQRMLEEYVTTRVYVELCKQELEIEKEILDETKQTVEQEQQAMEELIDQKKQDITKYETDISTQEKAIREYEAEIKAQDEEIAALEQMIAEEKKKILANSGVVLTYDGGKFVFPVKTYTRVSDDYGPRIHPTLHVPQFHNGVDLASPKGTPIYAAYDGVVVAADYSTTMGNYVMIDHGSGLYTIYMHASKLEVKKDEIVVRGDTIAKVGSTGRSTGNHLHFSVRLNGSYVSPWDYISKK